jgi:hypothetical protein
LNEAFPGSEYLGGLPFVQVVVLFGCPVMFYSKTLLHTPLPLLKSLIRTRDLRSPGVFFGVDFMNPNNPDSLCDIKFFSDGRINCPDHPTFHKQPLTIFEKDYFFKLGRIGIGREVVGFQKFFNRKTRKIDYSCPI